MHEFSVAVGRTRAGSGYIGVRAPSHLASIARRAASLVAVAADRLAASGRIRRSRHELCHGPAWRLHDIGYQPIEIEFTLMIVDAWDD